MCHARGTIGRNTLSGNTDMTQPVEIVNDLVQPRIGIRGLANSRHDRFEEPRPLALGDDAVGSRRAEVDDVLHRALLASRACPALGRGARGEGGHEQRRGRDARRS